MPLLWTYRKTEEALKTRLEPGEKVLHNVWGTTGPKSGRTCILAVTDRRVIRFTKWLLGEQLLSCPFSSITFLQESAGVFGENLIIHFIKGAIGFSHPGGAGKVEAFRALKNEINSRIRSSQPEQPKPEPKTSEDAIDKLTRLGDLLKQGIITPQEFEEKKKELLGRV